MTLPQRTPSGFFPGAPSIAARKAHAGVPRTRTYQVASSRRRWFRLGAAFLVLGLAAMPVSWSIEADAWWAHGVWCAIGIALSLPAVSGILRSGFKVVLTDHLVMFAGAFNVYFLFGALLLAIGPEGQIERALAFYSIDARVAMRVNSVNGIGFGLALITASLSQGRWLARQTDRLAAVATRVTADVAVLLFLLLGAAASLNVMTVDLGLRDGIAAGIWRITAKLSLVAIFLASAHRGRREKGLRFAAVLIALVEFAGGLLLFDKTAALLPLAALVAGLSMRYRRRTILPVGAILLAVVFMSSGGPVLFGRNTLVGNRETVVAERWQLLKEGMALSQDGSMLTAYDPWARLSYTTPQAAAMALYDVGRGGDEIRLIPWLFVPRVLAPNKPIISSTGEDLHTKVTGQSGSNTGQGIFVGGYYSAGWLGLILVSILCGWILAQTSAIARVVLRRQAPLLVPLALLGVLMAFRIDGDFLVDYFGAFVLILYVLVPAALLTRVSRRAYGGPR